MAASQLGYTPGSGANVATDLDDGGRHHQKALIEHLSGGVPTPISEMAPMPSESQRTDALLVMMSRIVKLLESSAVVDAAQRQRISVDSFIATIPAVTAVTTVTTVTTLSNATAIAGMDREQWINVAKSTCAQSIRARLEFV